jgi:hypothetical protein
MSKTETDLHLISKIADDMLKTQVKQDDCAIAKYVKQVCDQLKLADEDIKDYVSVRTTDMDIGGSTIQYSIVKRDGVKL